MRIRWHSSCFQTVIGIQTFLGPKQAYLINVGVHLTSVHLISVLLRRKVVSKRLQRKVAIVKKGPSNFVTE